MSTTKQILVAIQDKSTTKLIDQNILTPEGYRVTVVSSGKDAQKIVNKTHPDLMILGDDLPGDNIFDLAVKILNDQPTLPIVFLSSGEIDYSPRDLIRLGLVDWLTMPLSTEDVKKSVQSGLNRSQHWEEWLQLDSSRTTGPLLKKVDELETLTKVGSSITAQLELDSIKKLVVDAAVSLTSAEESSILLLDEDSGHLYIRAARNFQDEFVRTFRLEVEDSLAGEVIRTGKPVFVDSTNPQKIQTQYLVHALIYVPLSIHGRTIGVLGVDNRESGKELDESNVPLLTALANYSSIAMENARLYTETFLERNKLENILTQIRDGVLAVDAQENILLLNPTIREIFMLGEGDFIGK
ncbi:MAG: GAF domain-containing protein, partial [Chloroflexota bacterium]